MGRKQLSMFEFKIKRKVFFFEFENVTYKSYSVTFAVIQEKGWSEINT